jgi:hypothetical protein
MRWIGGQVKADSNDHARGLPRREPGTMAIGCPNTEIAFVVGPRTAAAGTCDPDIRGRAPSTSIYRRFLGTAIAKNDSGDGESGNPVIFRLVARRTNA